MDAFKRHLAWILWEDGWRLAKDAVVFESCQYIAGEPRSDDGCKCGRPTVGGSSYCREHYERCVTGVLRGLDLLGRGEDPALMGDWLGVRGGAVRRVQAKAVTRRRTEGRRTEARHRILAARSEDLRPRPRKLEGER